MCLGMNPDKMVARERSISTSNRNFEGRQGKGSRTHLASAGRCPAATAIPRHHLLAGRPVNLLRAEAANAIVSNRNIEIEYR